MGGGNNTGMRAAQGRYVLLLNSDAWLVGDALERLVAYAEAHPDVALAGPRLVNPDGTLAALGARLPDGLEARNRVPVPAQARAALARAERLLRRRLPSRLHARGRVAAGCGAARAARGGRCRRPLRRGLLHVQRGDGLDVPVPPGGLAGRLRRRCRSCSRRRGIARGPVVRREPARDPALSRQAPWLARGRARAPAAAHSPCGFARSSSVASGGRPIAKAHASSLPATHGRCFGDRLPPARVRDGGRVAARLARRARVRPAVCVGDGCLGARSDLRRVGDRLHGARLDHACARRARRDRRRGADRSVQASAAGVRAAPRPGPASSPAESCSARSSGTSRRSSPATGSSTSPACASSSTSATCTCARSTSSRTAVSTRATRFRCGTASTRSWRRSPGSTRKSSSGTRRRCWLRSRASSSGRRASPCSTRRRPAWRCSPLSSASIASPPVTADRGRCSLFLPPERSSCSCRWRSRSSSDIWSRERGRLRLLSPLRSAS